MLLSRAPAHWGGGTGITKTTQFNIVVKSALPTDKSFSQCTDAEIVQLAQALQSGQITTSDLNWNVGDTRSVTLSTYGTQQLVIYHKTGSGIKFTDGTDVHYVIGFENCPTTSKYHTSSNVYTSSTLKTTENSIYNALPSTIKSAFKQFNAKTAANGSATSATSYAVYMCSPAEKEVFGTRSNSVQAEANSLTQFDYFKFNRIKFPDEGSSIAWWERSPSSGYTDYACFVESDGTASRKYVPNAYGVSPFGCI